MQAPQDPAPDQLLKEAEAGALLRVSEKTLQNWRWRQMPPRFVRINRLVRYRLADIQAFIERSNHV